MSKRNRRDEWKHITVFDKAYPPEVLAEGLAVNEAVVLGKCDKCGFLKQCSSDDSFKPPVFAWCFRRKTEILSSQRREGKEVPSS